MEPQVTVGFCVRNNEETIREAIGSVLKQDFLHSLMELVIVDGDSQDKTLRFACECLENAGVVWRVFHENKGLGHARQMVVGNAAGKYIIWVDGDMIICRDYVSKLFEFMETHPEAGIIKGKQALKPGGNSLATLEAYSRVAGKMVDFSSEKAFAKVLGTSGCIYRTEAIRQVGGFDRQLRGYGEDWDAELKVRAAGWRLGTLDVEFLDYERNMLTWSSLWRRYWLRGYYSHYFLHKRKGLIKHFRMFPPAAFIVGILQGQALFRLTRQKKVFLLPLVNVFKFSAWYWGFLKSHVKSYQPLGTC